MNGHPVTVRLVEAIPEGAQPRSSREVREEGRLAVAGLGEHEDHPPMNLRVEPIEQPVAAERLLAHRWRLDLRRLDGIPVHLDRCPRCE